MASTKLERVKYSDKERDDYLLSFISINISYGSNVAVSSTNMSIDFKANEKEFNEFYLTLESVMKTRKSKTIKLINHTLNVSKMQGKIIIDVVYTNVNNDSFALNKRQLKKLFGKQITLIILETLTKDEYFFLNDISHSFIITKKNILFSNLIKM